MQAGIRTYLLADTTLQAALATATSVYSFPAPASAVMPYLVVSRVTGDILNLIGATQDIYRETWQVDVYAATSLAAEAVKELVVGRLNCADRVEMGSYTVHTCTLIGVTNTSDLEMVGGETAVARISLDFEFIRERPVTV